MRFMESEKEKEQLKARETILEFQVAEVYYYFIFIYDLFLQHSSPTFTKTIKKMMKWLKKI